MDTILQQINFNAIEIRLVLITLIIVVNFVTSIFEAIKLKTFSVKKLPEFIGEWMMCSLSIVFIEIIISLVTDSELITSVMSGVREIMLLSILACYFKKIFESLKQLGWDVDTERIINFINSKSNK